MGNESHEINSYVHVLVWQLFIFHVQYNEEPNPNDIVASRHELYCLSRWMELGIGSLPVRNPATIRPALRVIPLPVPCAAKREMKLLLMMGSRSCYKPYPVLWCATWKKNKRERKPCRVEICLYHNSKRERVHVCAWVCGGGGGGG